MSPVHNELQLYTYLSMYVDSWLYKHVFEDAVNNCKIIIYACTYVHVLYA